MTSNASSLAWRDEYSIGVAELDEQHKRLLELLNKLSTSETGFASGVTRPNCSGQVISDTSIGFSAAISRS